MCTNSRADALAGLASTFAMAKDDELDVAVCQRKILPSLDMAEAIARCLQIQGTTEELEDLRNDWRQPFVSYFKYNSLPSERAERVALLRRLPKYYFEENSDTLYRKSYDGLLLCCLSKAEARRALSELHQGVCGAHQPGPKLHMGIKRMGYYWPTMIADAMDTAKRCQPCQFHA